MRVFFRFDFGYHIGMGHFGRCLTLAESFRACGAEVGFISRPNAPKDAVELLFPNASNFFPLRGRPNTVTGEPSSWLGVSQIEDAIEVKQLVFREGVDLLVIDHYGIADAWYTEYGGASRTLTLCDYPAPEGVEDILDYGFDASIVKHEHVGNGKAFIGSSFALVSERFAEIQAVDPTNENPIRLVVALGGGAPIETWQSVAEGLSAFLPEAEISLAPPWNIRPTLQETPELSRFAVLDWAPIDHLMSQADAVVVSAGVSMYEVLASGYPHIAVVTAENQVAGVSRDCSPDCLNVVRDLRGGSELNKACLTLIDQLRNREPYSLESKSTVDTWGPRRVVLHYLDLDIEPFLRPFEAKDSPFLLRLANQKSVRESSFSIGSIRATSHLQWSSEVGANRRIWILCLGEVPIGQCRIEKENGKSYLHYAIDEEFRSRGLGKKMLRMLLDRLPASIELRAKLLRKNIASIRTLRSVGFALVYQDGDSLEMTLDPKRRQQAPLSNVECSGGC